MSAYEFYWERTKGGGARLLRVFADAAFAMLPEQIAGVPLTEIGAYCFSESRRLPESYERYRSREGSLHELSGRYLKELTLPDTVEAIGNLAFYNCTAFEKLTVGKRMESPGSDAFMNCQKLKDLIVRCGSGERSGVRQILSRISWEITVTFRKDGKTEAGLLFPEYYESYDEIAPAHLFGRSVRGEGFRARQCFRDGKVDFAQYDLVFPRACVEESAETLCRFALCRLRFPAELQQTSREIYASFLREHADVVCRAAVRSRDAAQVRFLCENGWMTRKILEQCVFAAGEADWAEGAACFLRLKEEFFPHRTAGNRYSFEDLV